MLNDPTLGPTFKFDYASSAGQQSEALMAPHCPAWAHLQRPRRAQLDTSTHGLGILQAGILDLAVLGEIPKNTGT